MEFASDGSFLFASFFIWVASFCILTTRLSFPVALAIASIRVLIPIIYFRYSGVYFFLVDDKKYHTSSLGVLAAGYDPFTIFFSEEGRAHLKYKAAGWHYLYLWWNMLAHTLFGKYYASGVFLNVVLSIATGAIFSRTIEMITGNKRYATAYLIMFLFHWEVVTWASFLNKKDILIMFLTVLTMLYCIKLIKKPSLPTISILVLLLCNFVQIRFYLIVFFIASFALWFVLYKRAFKLFFGISIVGAIALPLIMLPLNLKPGLIFNFVFPTQLLQGSLQFLLTPQPWSLSEGYEFLLFASTFNMLFFPALIFGFFFLWNSSKEARFILIYFALAVIFYAIVPDLRGPRSRLQLVPFTCWMQFHAIWVFVRYLVQYRQSRIAQPANPITV